MDTTPRTRQNPPPEPAAAHSVAAPCTLTGPAAQPGGADEAAPVEVAPREWRPAAPAPGIPLAPGTAAPAPDRLSDVQQAMHACHGLQCGFCTPGFVVSITALLARNPDPDDDAIRDGLSGNLCRCTGYQGIIKAVRMAAEVRGSS